MSAQCKVCGAGTREIYSGPIRFGNAAAGTSVHARVLQCTVCELAFLSENPNPPGFYKSEDYRRAYDLGHTYDRYLELHLAEQTEKLSLFDSRIVAGKKVCDVGAGPGVFLSLIKAFASSTAAIEPNRVLGEAARRAGHDWYESLTSAAESGHAFDVVFSFQTIEHVEDPLSFLKQTKAIMRPGARGILTTPNLNNLLMTIDAPAYKAFFFRDAHLFYFNAQSIRAAFQEACLQVARIGYHQVYDISNFALWLRDGRPTGLRRLDVFPETLDAAYRSSLEASGLADHLLVEFSA